MRATEFLIEGGNVWKGPDVTQRINKADVAPTVAWLEKLTGLPLLDNMLGTTGRKESSGDLDLGIDVATSNKEELATKLTAWAVKHDKSALIKKSGSSVHFRTPIKGDGKNGYVQTDFMFLPNLGFSKWSMAAVPSAFKDADKHKLLSAVAKHHGLKWSWLNGLSSRTTGNPLTGGQEQDYVAKTLLGPNAKADDVLSVESILDKLNGNPEKEEMIKDWKEEMEKEGHKIGDEHLKEVNLEETLAHRNGKWCLVSRKDPSKVLQYYHGSGRPSKEWVSKVERRVHSFSEGKV